MRRQDPGHSLMWIAVRRILRVHPYVRVMKTNILSFVSLLSAILLVGGGVCAAQPTLPPQPLGINTTFGGSPRQEERKFDLDFPGGTPQQLVTAVEKATGEPLNVIIPEQDREVELPALKMRQVSVTDLFAAMEQSSRRTEMIITGTYILGGEARSQYSQFEASTGFRKIGGVWVFTNKRPSLPPDLMLSKTRFYLLEPYLPQNKVEDITTAIQTAWKMMAENKLAPNNNATTELKFHKETGLLIAVGDAAQVQVIDDVLNALRPDLAIKPKTSEALTKTNAAAKP